MKRIVTAAVLGLVLSACGGPPPEPPAPPPLDPTGTYSISVDAEGMQVGGTLTIRQEGEGYSGYIDTDMGGAALANIVVEGQTVTFDLPEVGVSFEITFEGNEFTGTFDGAMGAGVISGVKREG